MDSFPCLYQKLHIGALSRELSLSLLALNQYLSASTVLSVGSIVACSVSVSRPSTVTWRLWYRFDGYWFNKYLLFLYFECKSLTFTLKRVSDLLGAKSRNEEENRLFCLTATPLSLLVFPVDVIGDWWEYGSVLSLSSTFTSKKGELGWHEEVIPAYRVGWNPYSEIGADLPPLGVLGCCRAN